MRPFHRTALLFALAACGDDPPAASGPAATEERIAPSPELGPGAEPRGDAARGRELVARLECNRCHEGTGLDAPPPEKRCVGCHREILAGRFEAPAEHIRRWQQNLVSLNDAPSLTAAGARIRRSWIERFLVAPHDLRPRLPATMPRLAVTAGDARDIAAFLVPGEERAAELPPRFLGEGRRLLQERGCGSCHAFGGVAALPAGTFPVAVAADVLARGVLLAPDLRHARERFQPGALVDWIMHPTEMKADSAMPDLGIPRQEAERMASYIVHAELAPEAPPATVARLPLLQRRVTFDEVNERLFQRVCWHCHSDPSFALGDGGPGNTGGFGFPGRGLDLGDYQGVMSGYRGDDGERRSLFLPGADGVPRIVAVLLARREEEAGRTVDGVRGMPLGLPSVPPEEVQLLESWIAQGRPQ